ncbi:MAG: response regulator [Chloroflexi bacterium]|nr:response regulator [Chloroflexota bacterium]
MTGKKILFVDDEELIRKLVTTYLERLGYVVTTATDGAQALRAVTADPPDLLITDVQLPSLSGLELTKRLRANQHTFRLPIIMLSAHNETDDVLAGYGQGADEYVSKPVELAVLGAKVAVLLRRANANGMEPKPGKRGVVIAFLHGKGGVGTTTLAVNTAILMARSETSSAVLVDLNRDYANADMLLDLNPGHRLEELARYNLDELDQTTFAEFLTPYSDGLSILANQSLDLPWNARAPKPTTLWSISRPPFQM